MKKIFTILAAMALMCSCDTSAEEGIDNETVEEQNLSDSARKINDFMLFFEQFNADPAYQAENVKFPYTVEMWELGAERPEVDKVYKEDWRPLNLHYDSGYATRKIDAYHQYIRYYGDTVKVEQRGIDNGIIVDYEFVKINGQWVLVAEKDYSG